jgi:hypothetical protein
MPILIAEATQEAIRLALLRHRCHRIATDQHSTDEARQVARCLDLLTIYRGTRRDVRPLQERAARLEALLG